MILVALPQQGQENEVVVGRSSEKDGLHGRGVAELECRGDAVGDQLGDGHRFPLESGQSQVIPTVGVVEELKGRHA